MNAYFRLPLPDYRTGFDIDGAAEGLADSITTALGDSVDAALADPMVAAVMTADGVDPKALEKMLRHVANHLAHKKAHGHHKDKSNDGFGWGDCGQARC